MAKSMKIFHRVPLRTIRKFAHSIAKRFHPEQIILFGSYACGTPNEDSDVDLLVIMDTPLHVSDQAIEISLAVGRPFSMDLLVRTPAQIRERLALGDYFIEDVVNEGTVLYQASNARVGR